jgi:hypothetical protein
MTSDLRFCRMVMQVTFVPDGSEMVALGCLHIVNEQSAIPLTTFEKVMIEKIMKNFKEMGQ